MYEQTMNNDVTLTGGENPLLAGRYQVVRQLGTGGMGSVWLAEDRQLDNKLFAVKMLPSVLVSNKRAYRQLKDEAILAMKLVHPNIVQIRAFEENNGNPFLVMDYIEGQTLDDYLAEKGKLTEDETVRLLKPIASALDYAHGEGVVHRDVKPANVMIRKDGHPYILDFGIAREIQETMTRVTGKLSSGTLLYMSPEQLRGQPPKAAQDVYSFAAMAYECLKGEPPFSRGQIEYQILNEQPERLPNDIRMSAAIMRGLSKTPENRPDSCVKVLLTTSPTRQMPSARPQVAVPPRPAAQMTDRIVFRPKRNVVGIVLPLFCLVAALLVLGGVLWHREAQRQENAQKQAVEQEELRRRQAEDERKSQEESSRKKAEAERLAKQQQEDAQRRAEEGVKRREAEKQARERELAHQKEEEARKAAEAKEAAIVSQKGKILEDANAALVALEKDPLRFETLSSKLTQEQRDALSTAFQEILRGEAEIKKLLEVYTEVNPKVVGTRSDQKQRVNEFQTLVKKHLIENQDQLLAFYITVNNKSAAKVFAKNVLRQNDSSPLANYVVGSIALNDAKYKEAEAHLRKASDIPDPIPLALNDLAEVLRRLNKLSEAERYARKAIEHTPKLYVSRLTLAEVLADQNKDLAEAEDLIREAIKLEQEESNENMDVRLYVSLARIQVMRGDRDGAKSSIDVVLPRISELNEYERNAFYAIRNQVYSTGNAIRDSSMTEDYVVKAGDSFGGIAYSHGTTIAVLKELNGLSDMRLRVGQILKVPIKSKKVSNENNTNVGRTLTDDQIKALLEKGYKGSMPSDVDVPPKPKQTIKPEYPFSSRERGEEGDVALAISINENGGVDGVVVQKSSGFSELDDAAVRAVKSAMFDPAKSGNKPVASVARLTLSFKLRGE